MFSKQKRNICLDEQREIELKIGTGHHLNLVFNLTILAYVRYTVLEGMNNIVTQILASFSFLILSSASLPNMHILYKGRNGTEKNVAEHIHHQRLLF